jgi:hypothetical protein
MAASSLWGVESGKLTHPSTFGHLSTWRLHELQAEADRSEAVEEAVRFRCVLFAKK